jgi:hypothetical protein
MVLAGQAPSPLHAPLRYTSGHWAENILTSPLDLHGAVGPEIWVDADACEAVRVSQLLKGHFETDAPLVWSGTGCVAPEVTRSYRDSAVATIRSWNGMGFCATRQRTCARAVQLHGLCPCWRLGHLGNPGHHLWEGPM